MLELIENQPFDPLPLEALFTNEEEFKLVWPGGKFPFDGNHWRESFIEDGRYSFFISFKGQVIGHLGLARENPKRYRLIFVFLHSDFRRQGYIDQVLRLADNYIAERFQALEVSLKVQEHNFRAQRAYLRNGFHLIGQDGKSLIMEKAIRI